MPNKLITNLVNKGVFGAVWLGLIAVITMIAGVVGIRLSVNITELGNNLSQFNIIGLIAWVGSTLIFAFIAVYMTRHSKMFKVFGRSAKDNIDIPKKVGILTLLVLGGLISIAIMVLNWFMSTIGAGDADISRLITTLEGGNIWGMVVAVFAVITVGYIVFGLASYSGRLQKSIKSSEFTKKIPDGSD